MISNSVRIIFCMTSGTIGHIECAFHPSKATVKQADLLGFAVAAESGRVPIVKAENTIDLSGAQNGVWLREECCDPIVNSQEVIQLLEILTEPMA
jgi:hypothetical protein